MATYTKMQKIKISSINHKKIMTKQEAHKQKRKQLQEISRLAKIRMQIDLEGQSVNEILINHFYTDNENYIFNTFHDWIKKGFKIDKGSEAFLIWGKPKNKIDKSQPAPEPNADDNEREFYPMCYLFSNAQVTKR